MAAVFCTQASPRATATSSSSLGSSCLRADGAKRIDTRGMVLGRPSMEGDSIPFMEVICFRLESDCKMQAIFLPFCGHLNSFHTLHLRSDWYCVGRRQHPLHEGDYFISSLTVNIRYICTFRRQCTLCLRSDWYCVSKRVDRQIFFCIFILIFWSCLCCVLVPGTLAYSLALPMNLRFIYFFVSGFLCLSVCDHIFSTGISLGQGIGTNTGCIDEAG